MDSILGRYQITKMIERLKHFRGIGTIRLTSELISQSGNLGTRSIIY